jgi:hypothetical protein
MLDKLKNFFKSTIFLIIVAIIWISTIVFGFGYLIYYLVTKSSTPKTWHDYSNAVWSNVKLPSSDCIPGVIPGSGLDVCAKNAASLDDCKNLCANDDGNYGTCTGVTYNNGNCWIIYKYISTAGPDLSQPGYQSSSYN